MTLLRAIAGSVFCHRIDNNWRTSQFRVVQLTRRVLYSISVDSILISNFKRHVTVTPGRTLGYLFFTNSITHYPLVYVEAYFINFFLHKIFLRAYKNALLLFSWFSQGAE